MGAGPLTQCTLAQLQFNRRDRPRGAADPSYAATARPGRSPSRFEAEIIDRHAQVERLEFATQRPALIRRLNDPGVKGSASWVCSRSGMNSAGRHIAPQVG